MGTEKDSTETNRTEITSLDQVERKQSPSGRVKNGRVRHYALDCGHGDWFYGYKGVPS
jgi:hypothetical protein